MAKKILVNADFCEECETCVSVCPEVFEMGADGKAFVKNSDACNGNNCQEAIDSCTSGL
jgi:ferredoxin